MFTDEQIELRDTLSKLFQNEVTEDYLKERIEQDISSDEKLRTKIASLGIFAGFATEDLDGFGLGTVELSLIAFEAGKVLLPENLIFNLLAGPYLCSRLFEKSLKKSATDSIVSGDDLVSIALFPSGPVKINNGKVSGEFRFVYGADTSRYFLCIGSQDKQNALILVDAKDKRIKIDSEDVLDPTLKAWKVVLSDTPIVASGKDETFFYKVMLLKASEAAGVLQRVSSLTAEYVKERKQFGVPVGTFQAVKHKVTDIYLKAQALSALTRYAAWAAESNPSQLPLAALSAILFAVEKAPEAIEDAIQAHGGIGFTWEYVLHWYLRRARSISALFGSGLKLSKEILRHSLS
ncbi:MAG: acyl-CoA dehydrogenase [Candidatus Dadabacteria bacterium]|nr:MAG: acyl-CoA dehydrogenase [Candidatus Dadabacteria bacterium]